MALGNTLILRKPCSGCLEGRTTPIQSAANSLAASACEAAW